MAKGKATEVKDKGTKKPTWEASKSETKLLINAISKHGAKPKPTEKNLLMFALPVVRNSIREALKTKGTPNDKKVLKALLVRLKKVKA